MGEMTPASEGAGSRAAGRPSKIAVIGLGAMGLPIARALGAAGHSLRVCDVDPSRTADVSAAVVHRTTSPADAAVGSDAVILVVANDRQLQDATLGSDGAVEQMQPGSMLIVHSTVSPGTCRLVAAAAEVRGISMVDAPLSGGVAGAEARTLITMVGATLDALEKARPLLQAYAKTVFHVGPVGAGQTAKLVNNLLATVHLAVAAEALALARAVGLDETQALGVVNACTGRSWATEGWHAILKSFASSPGGMAHVRRDILRKDLRLVEQLAEDADVPVPITAVAKQALWRLGSADRGDQWI